MPRFARFARLNATLAVVLCLHCAPARAMIHVPVYTGTPLLITGGVLNQQVLQNAERLTRDAPASRTARDDGVVPPGPPVAPRQLAAHYPAAGRDDAERLFTDLLQRFRGIEDQFDIPHRDLAGAVAAFVAGNHMAYHGTPFPDAHFKPLVAQMRELVSEHPGVAGAPAADRRQAYEQLAILGMFMAGAQMAQQQSPDALQAERLRKAAGDNLRTLLGVEPERVEIGPKGLRLASR
jgi:hypothetical protein